MPDLPALAWTSPALAWTRPAALPTPAHPLPAVQAPAGRAQRPAGPFKEALVFMLGGGNYLEYESLRWVLLMASHAQHSCFQGKSEPWFGLKGLLRPISRLLPDQLVHRRCHVACGLKLDHPSIPSCFTHPQLLGQPGAAGGQAHRVRRHRAAGGGAVLAAAVSAGSEERRRARTCACIAQHNLHLMPAGWTCSALAGMHFRMHFPLTFARFSCLLHPLIVRLQHCPLTAPHVDPSDSKAAAQSMSMSNNQRPQLAQPSLSVSVSQS